MTELNLLLQKAQKWFNNLSPDDTEDKRKSYVVGEMMLEHPTLTKEDAEALYDNLKK